MNKLAIFVEGQTEAIFLDRLLREISTSHSVQIETRSNTHNQRRLNVLSNPPVSNQHKPEYYALIFDCGGDEKVASVIRDQYAGLVKSGYRTIVGLRDVYPGYTFEEVARLRSGIRSGLPSSPVGVSFALAIMEIEAWFIAEHSHFERISASLTMDRIVEVIGFDPSVAAVDQRPCPKDDLNFIYSSVGLEYNTKRSIVKRTVDALDMDRIYLELRASISDLKTLLDAVDCFFTSND